jgi:hypothetical protein
MGRGEERPSTADLASKADRREAPKEEDASVAESEPGEERDVDEALEEEAVSTSDTPGLEADEQVDRSNVEVGTGAPEATEESEPLVSAEETTDFRSRWEAIQTGFVDEPRSSVQEADALVAELMQRLAETFSEERTRLEGQWDRGDEVSTEDLRIALQRYRAFFNRLLET